MEWNIQSKMIPFICTASPGEYMMSAFENSNNDPSYKSDSASLPMSRTLWITGLTLEKTNLQRNCPKLKE